MSWLRPSKRSASVFLPPGASKLYSLSTFTHGNCRRSALTVSRCRVRFFSFASSSLRAVIHSCRDTTLGLSIVLLLVTPLLMTLSPFLSPLAPANSHHFLRTLLGAKRMDQHSRPPSRGASARHNHRQSS